MIFYLRRFPGALARNWFILLALGSLLACGEGQDTAVLEIYVISSLGEEVQDAQVSIYANREDWQSGRSPVKEASATDRTGVVRFAGLADGSYFLDVVKGDTTNWAGRISTDVKSVGSFFVNRIFVVISSNQTNRLVATGGKRWRTVSYTSALISSIGTTPGFVTACAKDDIDIFFKGNAYISDEGASICPGSAQQTQGTWRLLENDTRLSIARNTANDTPGEAIVWTIVQLNLQIMQLTRDYELRNEQGQLIRDINGQPLRVREQKELAALP